MSTQNKNEDVKNSNARIAIGDLNANADVRGGAKTSKKGKNPNQSLPPVKLKADEANDEASG